jgi:hypothetical protein
MFKNVILPDFTVKALAPKLTDAETDPVAIWDKFNPTIPEAGMLNNSAPEPENKPADAVKLVNVDPVTINDPEIMAEPVNGKAFLPSTPAGPGGPVKISTTLVTG